MDRMQVRATHFRDDQIDRLMRIRDILGIPISKIIRIAVDRYIKEFYARRGEWAETDELYSEDPRIQTYVRTGARLPTRVPLDGEG